MCEVCGDPNCKALGTKISDLEMTDESNVVAKEIINMLSALCTMLNDTTGLNQLNQIKQLLDQESVRYDVTVLHMIDLLMRDINLKIYRQIINQHVQKAAQEEELDGNEEVDEGVALPFNKKLN